eukprot:29919-Pelagococcus_subviridis.AAC.2
MFRALGVHFQHRYRTRDAERVQGPHRNLLAALADLPASVIHRLALRRGRRERRALLGAVAENVGHVRRRLGVTEDAAESLDVFRRVV